MTLSNLNTLASDYRFTLGSCGLGSPRFSVEVSNGTTSGYIFFYIGPPPSYTGCPQNTWTNTGNLASGTNTVDDSGLAGGAFYDPYTSAQTKYGSYAVNDIALVVDYYQPPYQTAQFDNVQVNSQTYTFESADSCKNGGWQLFTASPGPFANQGQCVQYFQSSGGA